jgi:hypothetical protein
MSQIMTAPLDMAHSAVICVVYYSIWLLIIFGGIAAMNASKKFNEEFR